MENLTATRTQINRVEGFEINSFRASVHGFTTKHQARAAASAMGVKRTSIRRVANRFWWGFVVAEVRGGTLHVWSKSGGVLDIPIV